MAAAFGLSLSQASAAAGSTPDTWETYPPAGSLAMTAMAQTFTPNNTGQLYQVSLYAGTAGSQAATFYINIWSTTGDQPSAPCAQDANNRLTTKEVLSLGSNRFNDFPLAHSVSVTGGVRYAIVVCSPLANIFRWSYEKGETYSGGAAFTWSGGWVLGGTSVKDFDFKAWVSLNSAPAVATDGPGVSVPEGTVPTMTGTYSDADGDTVALSATPPGTVKWTGTSSGTWQWTGTASDEAPTQRVVITADDGHGLSNQKSFTVDITPVAPVAHILTAPGSVPEGKPASFTGAATSPGPGDTFTYAWKVNGATFATGSESAFSFTPADEGAYVVTLQVTDDGGMPSDWTSPVTVTETEITPTVTIDPVVPTDSMLRSPLIITPGESLNFSGNFSDAAGTADSHTVSWDFGDGTPAATVPSTGAASTTHSYALAGTYTVTLTASDDDNAKRAATTQVTVQTAQQSLGQMIPYVQGLSSLNDGQRKSLIAKLNAASDAAARGDNKTASNQLNAFLNELQADYNTGKISYGAYSTLRLDAHTVQGALGTYNRFLEWWPLQA